MIDRARRIIFLHQESGFYKDGKLFAPRQTDVWTLHAPQETEDERRYPAGDGPNHDRPPPAVRLRLVEHGSRRISSHLRRRKGATDARTNTTARTLLVPFRSPAGL